MHREKVITLESRLVSSLYNINNYVNYKTGLKGGVTPPKMTLYYDVSPGVKIKIAEADANLAQKVFFDSNLEECSGSNNLKCLYFVELKWTSFGKLKTQVGLTQTKSGALNLEPHEFEIPQHYYNDNNSLSCPNDGITYLGIKSYDFSTNTVVCWKLDKSVTCPSNSYPVGIIPKPGSSDEFVVDCKNFPIIHCPQGYAPSKIYPLSNGSLTKACVSILDSKIPLRIGHIAKMISDNTPPNHSTNYGLKWTAGKLCPSNYLLAPKAPYAGTVTDDLRDIFNIQDGVTKTSCTGVRPVCGLSGNQYFCDMCPVSNSSFMQGCSVRSFPAPPNASSNATCKDPKIFSISNSALSTFRNNYECKLDTNLEFADAAISPF